MLFADARLSPPTPANWWEGNQGASLPRPALGWGTLRLVRVCAETLCHSSGAAASKRELCVSADRAGQTRAFSRLSAVLGSQARSLAIMKSPITRKSRPDE